MKVVITGATGFLGQALVPALRARGDEVVVLSRDAEPPMDDDEVTEADPPGESFLARVCRDWEAEARGAEPLGVRVATMRTGLVLGGGALAKMATPFQLFAGGPAEARAAALAEPT